MYIPKPFLTQVFGEQGQRAIQPGLALSTVRVRPRGKVQHHEGGWLGREIKRQEMAPTLTAESSVTTLRRSMMSQ